MTLVLSSIRAGARRWGRSLYDAWFAPEDPRVLAVCRVLMFGYIWPGFRVSNFAKYTNVASNYRPVSYYQWLDLPLPSATTLDLLSATFSVASLFALLGLLYPISGVLTASLAFYLLGLPHNFGKIDHDGVRVLVLCVLALSKSADAWSLDALLKSWRRRTWVRPAPSGDYRWPVRFVALLVVMMYGAAGWSKLTNTGWSWALSDSFQRTLLRAHFINDPPTHLGVWLADYPDLCQMLALAALSLEAFCPLSMLSRWAYRVFIPGLALLQFSIWLMMGVLFRHMIYVFLCLAPWGVLLGRLDPLFDWGRARLRRAAGGA